ncbi:MAG: hypothetical protein WCH34_08860 [Bacteroidota bacterium]
MLQLKGSPQAAKLPNEKARKMKNRVLLIGNDINNASANYSWSDLLSDLIGYARLTEAPSMDNKPFPLFYEEIYLSSARQYGTKESDLKDYIAAKTRQLVPNEIHSEILSLGIKTILTSNYDLTLEQVMTQDMNKLKNMGYIKESLYSLFRLNKVNEVDFWHIHGWALAPKSITLGYEHYGGYLQQMRNYVVTGTKGSYAIKDFLPMYIRLRKNEILYESWVDYFFTHDIDIFGLKLDFVEMHLWWLLTYRARAKVAQRMELKNKIRYYYPEKFANKSKHILELLRANEVETIPVIMEGDDRIKYYKKVLKRIRGSL